VTAATEGIDIPTDLADSPTSLLARYNRIGLIDDIDQQARERVGTVLSDKWTLERMLGIGGMAAVYEGRHRNGARAAIKLLHPSLSRYSEVRERFLREGYAANKVEHPGAVKVLDDDVIASGPDAGAAYIVMELLDGESLQDRLERGPQLTETEFLAIAAEVLDVLDAAHGRGVVHRDLKPENLFLLNARTSESDALGERERPRVKVLDFGLARLLDGKTITSHGLALGTPSFMSPEQAAGRIDEIDGRTDLFALGATGFRVRTGRRVQEGAGPVELVTKMANFAAPRIRTLAPEVSEPFARVVDRALEFKREDRYPDAASMRDDVRRALKELGEPDANARTLFAAEVPAPSVVPISVRPPPPPPPPRAPQPASEPTLEVSESDIAEPSGAAAPREPSLPVMPSVPHRRKRSLLPWLTLALLAAIGGKYAWDARTPADTPNSAPASASASSSPSIATSASTAPSFPVASAFALAAPPPATHPIPTPPLPPTAAATAPPPRAAQSPAAAAAPHHTQHKLGPGNVHVLSPKHRKH
jgi:eukaryotic-like serine/threonine-protein kinase